MHNGEQVEQNVPTMGEPEGLEEMTTGIGYGEHVHHDYYNGEDYSSQS